MQWFAILVLAVVQGITEFLPISSDGHLVVAQALFRRAGTELPNPLGVNIVLHAGTLGSILVYFHRRVIALLFTDRRTIGLIVVGTLPAVVVGLAAKRFFSHELLSAHLAGAGLIANGLVLVWARRLQGGDVYYDAMSRGQALAVGVAQSLAILPGVSRSGSTIVTGLVGGLRRESAATFSFLLAIPAIGGACTLELFDMLREPGPRLPAVQLAVGALVSFLVGLLALGWLLEWLRRGRLHYFGYWCLAVGLVTLVLAARQ